MADGEFTISDGVLLKYNGESGKAVIPEEVVSIGEGAFSWCDSLTSVDIPEGVCFIGYRAFYLCDNLVGITIPDSVTYIGDEAFSGCERLTEISVGKGNEKYCSQHGVLYSKDMTRLILCPCGKSGSLTISEGVSDIREWAFGGCYAVTDIVLPDSVKRIGEDAFSGCTSLERAVYRGKICSYYTIDELYKYAK